VVVQQLKLFLLKSSDSLNPKLLDSFLAQYDVGNGSLHLELFYKNVLYNTLYKVQAEPARKIQASTLNMSDNDVVKTVMDAILQYFHTNKLQPSALYSEIDQNDDGFITIDEFSELVAKVNLSINRSQLQQCFDYFDRDKDRRVNLREFVKVLEQLEEQQRLQREKPDLQT